MSEYLTNQGFGDITGDIIGWFIQTFLKSYYYLVL
jgi:hypothetical protein